MDRFSDSNTIRILFLFLLLFISSCEEKGIPSHINVSTPTQISDEWVLMPDQILVSNQLGLKVHLTNQEAVGLHGESIEIHDLEDKSYMRISYAIEIPASNLPDELNFQSILNRDKNLINAPSAPEKTLGEYLLYRAKKPDISPELVNSIEGRVLCIEYLMASQHGVGISNLIDLDRYSREGDDAFLGSRLEIVESE